MLTFIGLIAIFFAGFGCGIMHFETRRLKVKKNKWEDREGIIR
jgi:hypothetical protein